MSAKKIEALLPRRAARWNAAPLGLKIGVVLVAVHLIVAAIGPFVAPYGPGEIGTGLPLSPASFAHPGRRSACRDVFSRVLYGSHIVILLSFAGTAFGLVIGSAAGLLSAYVAEPLTNLYSDSSKLSFQYRISFSVCWRSMRQVQNLSASRY
jgi:ABC-type dipeptide/oligopeptide/nickel transport system permease subunit